MCIFHEILVSTENWRRELFLKVGQAAANTTHIAGKYQNIFKILKFTSQPVIAVFGDNYKVIRFSNLWIVKVYRRL